MRHLGNILRVQVPIWLVTPFLGVVLVLGFGGGYFINSQFTTACPQSSEVCTGFANFWRAWDVASAHFVDPEAIDPQTMTDGAIAGMINSLGDQGHTRYLPAEAAAAERESLAGRFEGIGAFIDVRDGQPLIIAPIRNSPAEAAGLLADDLIMEVDGEDVRGVTVEELQSKVRGPKGTSVFLTIQRGEETLEVEVQRDEVQIPSVTWAMLPEDVALIELTQFSEPSSEDIEEALTGAQAAGATALILDLRNNPGGLVDELISIASEFLPENTTVLLEQNRDGEQNPYRTSGDGLATDLPMVVLVNGGSASSAEILAGALKEQDRATVIGTPTFGTATVLRRFELNDGAQILLGTTEWLTPNGKQVRGVGIEPDEIVTLPPQTIALSPEEAAELSALALQESEDAQLARAFEVVREEVAQQNNK